MSYRRNAFSLMELMIVIVILGLLAGLVMPALLGRADKAKQDLVCVTPGAAPGVESVVFHFLDNRKEHGESMFRYTLCGVSGDVFDGDAQFLGCFKVDVVHPRGCDADEFEAGGGLHDLAVDDDFVGDDDLRIADMIQRLIGFGDLINLKLPESLERG